MNRALYLQTAAVVAVALLGGCKRRDVKLTVIAANLDRDLGDKPMPSLNEPEKLADRLAHWDDFRSCTVRTFAARKREFDKAKREGTSHPMRNASIGEAAVEECVVESAIVNKDVGMCQRLATDFEGPNGEIPLGAIRCWDTHARVFGNPDECPVVWLGDDLPGRNPECVAIARRDGSVCTFAEDPPRCRAILAGDPLACQGAAADCQLATNYWSGIVPGQMGPPLFDLTQTKDGEPAVFATVNLHPQKPPSIRITGPQTSLGISWPMGKTHAAMSEDTTTFWGGNVAPEAVQLTWRAGQPAVKVAFNPGGAASGTRPFKPPGALAPATILLSWPDPHAFRTCAPGPKTTGELSFDAGAAQPGGFVSGHFEAKDLVCSDNTTVGLSGQFRLAIVDVR
jgi:hypothetical protein